MSAPHYDRHGVTVHHGDCLDVLRTLPDASVDAVVTDPPYGLSDLKPDAIAQAVTAWTSGDRASVPSGKGFMGKAWDAFVPPPAVWDECLRVLKPGGHLAVFAAPRCMDLVGLSIRLAGFEIRDGIGSASLLAWTYGAGFPKGIDVSKAIDKAAGAERAVVGTAVRKSGNATYDKRPSRPDGLYAANEYDVTAPATAAARQWQGWSTQLKPAWEPIILARRPLAEQNVAANVLAHGTGAINIDACRVQPAGAADEAEYRAKCASVVGLDSNRNGAAYGEWSRARTDSASAAGRWPSNVVLSHAQDADGGDACADGCVEGCPVAELDAQSGISTKPSKGVRGRGGSTYANGAGFANTLTEVGQEVGYGDSGGASRYFPTFRWEPKTPTSERPMVGGVSHPTVKPLSLLIWLTKLLTPPRGTVLDPFAGTGTTLQAARANGFKAIGIEREPAYLPLIVARLDARGRTTATEAAPPVAGEPLDLLDLLDGEVAS